MPLDVGFYACGTKTPGARYRILQLLPHLEERGVRCTFSAAYGDRYNAIAPTRLGLPYKVAARAKRGLNQVRSGHLHDLVMLQRKAFRELVVFEELMARRGARIVFDFDDSIFLSDSGGAHAWRRSSFDAVCEVSAHLIAGNAWLAAQARRPEKTTVIPTVIDTDRYTPPARRRDDGKIVVGWMGTASSFTVARALIPQVLEAIEREPRAVFRVVSNATFDELSGHPQVEQIRWSAETEVDLLRSFDIGLMPMLDNDLTRGKCGFKMILYMSVGCPVVSSAVGANVDILEGSGAGLLVEDPSGWGEALGELLAASPEERARMGEAARAHAVAHYSVASVIDRYVEVFERVARAAR